MKSHTTNYFDTFIQVADDCPTDIGIEPGLRGGKKTVAKYQYDLLINAPYMYTSDEVFFKEHAIRNDLVESDYAEEWERYFSKGQPCFRASPLTKRFGWGVHCDENGKVAIYARESEEYTSYIERGDLEHVKAMRSKRK